MAYETQSNCVLIVDDEPEVAGSLINALKRRKINFEIFYASTHSEALEITKNHRPQVAILDLTLNLNVGPESGLNLLNDLIELNPSARHIVLTAHLKSEKGIEALNRGAFTYLEKPGDPNVLLAFILDGIEITNLKREIHKQDVDSSQISSFLGTAPSTEGMTQVTSKVEFAIKTNQPVLITGETGTGKGVLARLIHRMSQRKNYPFVRYQPSFTNPDLVASELFGHKKGAFTGATEDRKGLIEQSNLGTLFIDEIDALPLGTQVSLLETLQEKSFRRIGNSTEHKSDFRLISALNKDPKIIIEKGMMRIDFFHRIAHFIIELPPLRERKEDLAKLSQSCLDQICERENLDISFIDETALYKLKEYNWPGNIRELQAVLESAAFRASILKRKFITAQDLTLSPTLTSLKQLSFREKVDAFEEEVILKALKEANGNQAQAAKNLKMDRTVFRRILNRVNDVS